MTKKTDAEKLRILSKYILLKDSQCETCIHENLRLTEQPCNRCSSENDKYEPVEAIKIAREVLK